MVNGSVTSDLYASPTQECLKFCDQVYSLMMGEYTYHTPSSDEWKVLSGYLLCMNESAFVIIAAGLETLFSLVSFKA